MISIRIVSLVSTFCLVCYFVSILTQMLLHNGLNAIHRYHISVSYHLDNSLLLLFQNLSMPHAFIENVKTKF